MAKSKKTKATNASASKGAVASNASLTSTNVNGETTVASEVVETPQAGVTNVIADLETNLGTTSSEPEALGSDISPVEKVASRNGSVAGDDAIRRRAYEIYLERNGAPGNPLHDWQRAERELRGE